MVHAQVVIGANFGDEGKGLMTDYLTSRCERSAIVVRFNGGAQAGHTVQLPNGPRHVFSHFGSGTFANAETYLSQFFITNPILFCQEWDKLAAMNVIPIVYVDPNAPVTTPYDMLINQIIEETRKEGRHGSCGVGIGETIERGLDNPFRLTVHDCFAQDKLIDQLVAIKQEWLPKRLIQLGVASIKEKDKELIDSEIIFNRFLEDVDFFVHHIRLADISIINTYEHVLFEGAQGLLLDQDRGWFPHVTRSNTGLQNVISLAQQTGISALNIHYVTRAYLTRHGAGPLPHESMDCLFEDKTNLAHPFQGNLRFAPLDIDLLKYSIATDLSLLTSDRHYEYHLAVTCLDQVSDEMVYWHDQNRCQGSINKFLSCLQYEMGCSDVWCSYGPERRNISLFQSSI